MKEIVKEILDEMVLIDNPDQEHKYFQEALDKLGFAEVRNLISWILQWQKHLLKYGESLDDDYQEDRFILIEPHQERYPFLYEYCSELNEIFKLNDTEIIFNDNLTEDELEEIKIYINANYQVTSRWRRRRLKIRPKK